MITEQEFKQLKELAESGKASAEELAKLEPFRAKRAIFFAAGRGTRMKPITLNTPKPLIRVNGVRIIDTLIDACLRVGIEEIYVVRGYLSEQFDVLKYKYPMIKFLENPVYDDTNNITSAVLSRTKMANAYVFESDIILKNPDLIQKYSYYSSVLGIQTERSKDWCLIPDQNGFVQEEVLGGSDCYKQVGIYYWTAEDGHRLSEDINTAFIQLPEGRQLYWETVPNNICRGKYKIQIRLCLKEDVVELDTFAELKAVDEKYKRVGGE